VRLEVLPQPVDKPISKPEKPSPLSRVGDRSTTKKTDSTANTMKKMEQSTSPPKFPKHLQITFTVSNGVEFLKVGELRHELDIDGSKYTLKATKQAVGLSNKEQLIQSSYGNLDEHGLQPDTYTEERANASGEQSLEVTFDRKAHKVNFSNGANTVLPDDAQDILSFMYQLSQISMQREIIPLPISDTSQLKQNLIEIGAAEYITTPLGNLQAMHLSKMHIKGEPYFEIWLGLEYRLFPVKFRQVDGMGQVTGEYVISDIRAED
jgi:hypothetical protein